MDTSTRQEFETTALTHLDAVYGAALRLTRNSSEAEDLVQDAYIRAYRFWHTFHTGTSIRAWLFTILRNTFITRYHRTNRVRSGRSDLEAQLQSLGAEAAVGHPQAQLPSPELALAARINRDRIAAALESVPEDYRLAVTLADLEGLSYKEIAEIMDCPIGTVMSRIYRGRRLLHKLLYDHALELGLVDPPADATSVEAKGADDNTVALGDYRRRGKA